MTSSVPRLHRAASRGDVAKLKEYITAGDNVNARDAGGSTALLEAVTGCHTTCVEVLLAEGADPSISDNEEFFPLYVAAQNNNVAVAKALIDANANINAKGDRPDSAGTALCKASSKGSQAIVKLLLAAGCDTSKPAGDGRHPLTMLLDAGADVSAMGSDGTFALLAGVFSGSCDAVEVLLERGADVNKPDPLGRTALHTWPHNRDLTKL